MRTGSTARRWPTVRRSVGGLSTRTFFPLPGFSLPAAAALALATLVGCGSDQDPTVVRGQSATTTTSTTGATTAVAPTTTVPRTFSGDLTSTDGYRYRITLEVGDKLTAAAADECAAAPGAGRAAVRVTLTVANTETNRPAPSPPVRIELNGPGGRQQVLVRDPTGTCTFTPRVPSIGAGQSVVYRGTTSALAADAAPGSAGQVEVAVSETRFSLSAPVP